MDIILCPNCDTEFNENEKTCPSCGWVNSSASNSVKGLEGLSPESIDAFQSGQDIEFYPDEDLDSDSAESEVINDTTDEIGFTDIKEIEKDDNENNENNVVKKTEKNNENEPLKKSRNKKEKTPKVKKVKKTIKIKKEKSSKSNKVIHFFISFFMVVVAFTLGGLSFYLYNQFNYADDTFQTGYDAVILVSGKVPDGSRFEATDIYIKPGSQVTHCIIFGEIVSNENIWERNITYYRLEIDNQNPANTVLYYAFDEAEYNRLKNGSDEAQIKASIMKSYYDNFLMYVNEINIGEKGWRIANTDYINMQINNK